jgi:hypothetical protein
MNKLLLTALMAAVFAIPAAAADQTPDASGVNPQTDWTGSMKNPRSGELKPADEQNTGAGSGAPKADMKPAGDAESNNSQPVQKNNDAQQSPETHGMQKVEPSNK